MKETVEKCLSSIIYDEKTVQEIKTKLGEEIRSNRKKQGITLKQFAEMTKIPPYILSNIERNKSNYTIESYLRCKDVLKIE